jgi:hypothetical protein
MTVRTSAGSLAALLLASLVVSTANAAPPPPPPGGPPSPDGSPAPPPTDVPPPFTPPDGSVHVEDPDTDVDTTARAPDNDQTARVRMLGRPEVRRRGRVVLRLSCTDAFSVSMRTRFGRSSSRHVVCRGGAATVRFRLSHAARRALRRRHVLKAVVRMRIGTGPISHKRVRLDKEDRARPAVSRSVSRWASQNAWVQCDTPGSFDAWYTTLAVLNWQTSDGSIEWAYHQVWMQEYWGDGGGWTWRNLDNVENAAAPLVGPYRVGPDGVAEWMSSTWTPFGGTIYSLSPWSGGINYGIGQGVYVRVWVRLWIWTGDHWTYGDALAMPTQPASDAPEYCFDR